MAGANLAISTSMTPLDNAAIDGSGPRNDQRAKGAWIVLALCVFDVGALSGYQALPVVLGALARHGGFSDQQIGWLGSFELSGILAGSLCLAALLRDGRMRQLGAFGLVALSVGLLLGLHARGFTEFAVARLVVGLGAGLANALAIVAVANTASCSRNLGILNAAVIVAGAVGLSVLGWVAESWGFAGVTVALLVAALAGLLCVRWLPDQRPVSSVPVLSSGVAQGIPVSAVVPGLWLIAAVLTHMAPAASWAYGERLASLNGLGMSYIGNVLTGAALLSALFCLASARLAARHGPLLAACACVLGLLLAMGSWYLPFGGALGYALRIAVTLTCWGLVTVYQIAGLATMRVQGRWVALMPAAQGLGLAVGPAVSAALVGEGRPLALALAITASLLVIPLALMLSMWRALRHPALAIGSMAR